MSEIIEYYLCKSAYFHKLANEYFLYGNDHMAAVADMKSAQYWYRALRYGYRVSKIA